MKVPLTSFLVVVASGAMAVQIGQSQPEGQDPIRWYRCEWCVADKNDNVYLPDGWMIPRGCRAAVRMAKCVTGRLLSDGKDLYQWIPGQAIMTRIRVVDDGLEQGKTLFCMADSALNLALSPHGLDDGFAAKGKFFAYDAARRLIIAYAADGTAKGVVLDVGRLNLKSKVQSFAIHPKSGDLLLQSAYPDCFLRRFRSDGTEVKNAMWPRSLLANGFAVCAGELYAVREGACPIKDVLGDSGERIGDGRAFESFGMAWGGGGWWLATTQGALYYPKEYPTTCIKRLGGVTGVTALAVSPKGEVVASAGCRIYAFMLDDDRDEPPMSTESWMWYLGGGWSEACVSAIWWHDGLFFLRDEKNARIWALNLNETNGAHRDRRMFVTNEMMSAQAPALVSGRWRVAYDDRKCAIVRTKISANK